MARAPNLHLNPVNGAWALGFCLLVSGTAAGLWAFGVAWSIILAWVLVSGAIFVMLEPGLIASLWDIVMPEERKAKPIELATNLHQLGIADKTIQRILRHSNVAVTQGCYIKTADPEVASAMHQFERSLEYAPIYAPLGCREIAIDVKTKEKNAR
jgi:hypothetical protein